LTEGASYQFCFTLTAAARRTEEQALKNKALNPPLNYPGTKLIDKTRDALGKTKKVYDQPVTPYERLLVRDEVPREAKDRLRARRKRLNLDRLQDALDKAVDRLLQGAQRY
jgi:hypothetical protein